METDRDLGARLEAATRRMELGGRLSGGELAGLVKAIAEHELEEGGPYARRGERRADWSFNLSIAYFLVLVGVSLPKLDAYVEAGLGGAPESMLPLVRRWQESRQRPGASGGREIAPEEERMLILITKFAQERFAPLMPELRERCLELTGNTMRGNSDGRMPLMAFHMRQALGRQGDVFTDIDIAELGLANVFFWTAFVIYDDFWDEDEAAEPRSLPAANLLARSFTDHFLGLFPGDPRWRSFFSGLMDGLDGANGWETAACRAAVEGDRVVLPRKLPDYGGYENKFLPSAGHVLGPAAMLVRLGYGVDSPQMRHLLDYFRHHLIARQMNDDMHDWEEDLRRGHLSPVVVMLLEDYAPQGGVIDIGREIDGLRQAFWFKTLARAAGEAVRHARMSRSALDGMAFIREREPLARFIDLDEHTALRAIERQKESAEFLEGYRP